LIYDNSDACFESEKERNLYYKLFAGYLFNELVLGYEGRVQAFFDLLKSPVAIGQAAPSLPQSLDPHTTHVSFDNHLYLFHELQTDRGECADILLHDRTTGTFIAIEAKLHSNWSYEKDIKANQARHSQLMGLIPKLNIVPVLLVTEPRWEQAIKKESAEHSNYTRFSQDSKCCFRVILWEQVASIIPEPRVREFLDAQIARDRDEFFYRSTEDWFVQVSSNTVNQ